MQEEFLELAIHTLLFALYGVLTAGLTAVSALVEYRSYLTVTGGDLLLAGWMAAIGVVALTFAYFLLRDKAMIEYRYLTG
ncbi:hypothetical protein [Halalkalicoccus subterraneus]|uniref:hypothetical protein n=1 Tax=Halalkalicoccus subterraneus TaxID=2675002 RepID=UPI000EFB65AE|nr:hypothetical protein [Halalkalicoccus subterraneus]